MGPPSQGALCRPRATSLPWTLSPVSPPGTVREPAVSWEGPRSEPPCCGHVVSPPRDCVVHSFIFVRSLLRPIVCRSGLLIWARPLWTPGSRLCRPSSGRWGAPCMSEGEQALSKDIQIGESGCCQRIVLCPHPGAPRLPGGLRSLGWEEAGPAAQGPFPPQSGAPALGGADPPLRSAPHLSLGDGLIGEG